MWVNIDTYSLAVTTLIGLITFKRSDKPHMKWLRLFLVYDLATEVAGIIISNMHRPNQFLFTIYSIVELSFFLYFFSETIYGAGVRKKIRALQIAMPILWLLNVLFLQGPRQFSSYTFSLGCLILVTLGFVYLYRLFKNKEQVNLLREPSFWVSVGVIFFFMSALWMAGVFNYIAVLPKKIITITMILVKTFAVFFDIFLIIAFLCQQRRSTPK